LYFEDKDMAWMKKEYKDISLMDYYAVLIRSRLIRWQIFWRKVFKKQFKYAGPLMGISGSIKYKKIARNQL
jgi:hypothetical protein